MSERPLIEQVYKGMTVIDSAGDNIGKVDDVRFANAADIGESGVTGLFSARSSLPETVRERYRAAGFFHVDGKGWIDTDRFVLATEIDRIDGNQVILNVAKEQLPEG